MYQFWVACGAKEKRRLDAEKLVIYLTEFSSHFLERKVAASLIFLLSRQVRP